MDRARRLLKTFAAERSRRRRRLPALAVTARPAAERTVYYLCPDLAAPSGGVRVIYRHVDILNAAGIRAAVLHHRDGYSCEWFEHSTPVLGAPSVRLTRRDVVVVPEIYGPYFDLLPDGPELIAFNQNAYLTFDRLRPRQRLSYDRFAAALTVSPDSAEYLRFAFPRLDVSVVGNAVDPAVFDPGPGRPGRRIAMMPRKRREDGDQILRLLGPRLDGWEVTAISSSSESEVAAMLGNAPIFLALGKQEGFGMPVAEAMACGCYVVGFHGFGGRELFDPDCSTPVEDGDVLGAARALAAALERYEADPDEVRAAGSRARARILRDFSLDRQRDELLGFYERL